MYEREIDVCEVTGMAHSVELEENVNRFINSDEKNIRVVAGPGTGKSFAINKRIAKLINGGADPRQILAITFTRAAAADLRQELEAAGSQFVEARTVHSLCMKILISDEVLRETKRNPRMLMEHEIKTMQYDLDNPDFGDMREKSKRIKAYEAAWARWQHDEPGYNNIDRIDKQFEKDVVDWMKFHRCMLIGEVVPVALKHLQNNPYLESENIKYVLVDEYQDLNKAEQVLIQEIGKDKKVVNIVLVGDDDQSIYSFKHAHPEGIRDIPKLYQECKDFSLRICRRCPQWVIELANELIEHNRERESKPLKPFLKNLEGVVDIIQWRTLEDEVIGIAKFIQQEIGKGLKPKDILILTPRRLIGYELRDRLMSFHVKVKSYFREDALPKKEVQYAFSLLYFLAIPDDLVSLRYLLGSKSSAGLKNQYKKLKGLLFEA